MFENSSWQLECKSEDRRLTHTEKFIIISGNSWILVFFVYCKMG